MSVHDGLESTDQAERLRTPTHLEVRDKADLKVGSYVLNSCEPFPAFPTFQSFPTGPVRPDPPDLPAPPDRVRPYCCTTV